MRRVLLALKMSGPAGQNKLCGIFRALGAHHNWKITFIRTGVEFTTERIAEALKSKYDGYIVSIPKVEAAASLLAGTDVPTVVMDIHEPRLQARRKNIVFIRNSAEDIGKCAARELLASGRCRSYAFMHHPDLMEWSVNRCLHFREHLRNAGLFCHELFGVKEIDDLEKPVGIFAANDDRAFDVLEYCRRNNMEVPRDALVLGINNDTLICENSNPPLTSIQPDFNEEGYLAVKTLTEMMDERLRNPRHFQPARTLHVKVKQIVHRESTSPLSPAGLLVQKALVFARKNACEGATVDDVVRHLGSSRRLAEMRFRELQNQSIGDFIIALQMEKACQLLADTAKPISMIAAECGYSSPAHLMTIFKKRHGITMKQFRDSSAEISGGK